MRATVDHWIGGASVTPHGGEYVEGIRPQDGGAGARVAAGDAHDVDQAVRAAERAARAWRKIPARRRVELLSALADALRASKEEVARLESEDTGKFLDVAVGEVEHSASFFDYYASLISLPVGEVLDVEPDQHIYTIREPFGVVGIITPWNIPLNQAARACAPALAAGNVVVVKPALTTSQSTVAMARLASEIGFPDGVLNVVLGRGQEVGNEIVAHPGVRKIAFTGSVPVGQSIGRVAADRIIPLTLELGGKSANIVFADADLDAAAHAAVRAFTNNAGQVCSAGSRLLVDRSILDSFVSAVVEIAREVRPGRDMGPMITRSQYEQVQEYFRIAAEEGATILLGGAVSDDPELAGGFYIEPTVYMDVDNSMRVGREEIFGPVLVIMPFETEAEAVQIANDSEYGLVAGIWTTELSRAIRVSEELEVGQVFVNTWSTGAVQASFGGHKRSGYGREKGIEALHHYTHVKSVTIRL